MEDVSNRPHSLLSQHAVWIAGQKSIDYIEAAIREHSLTGSRIKPEAKHSGKPDLACKF